jgi:hypothetical protein
VSASKNPWIERVKEADAEAEAAYQWAHGTGEKLLSDEQIAHRSLVAIAAELRAQRISRRPGAGQ